MIFGVGTDLVEIKRIHEMKSHESFAIKILSEEELLVFNELSKPKKVNSDIGNPDNCKLDIIEEGPGTEVTLILFSIQYCTKL